MDAAELGAGDVGQERQAGQQLKMLARDLAARLLPAPVGQSPDRRQRLV